jgi:DNA-binding CsgD family transcriptional regulator
MVRPKYRSLLAAVDKLYAAALERSEWPVFLSAVASMLDADNAFVCRFDNQYGPSDYISLSQFNRKALPVQRFAALMADDPRLPVFNATQRQPVHCRMAVSEARLHSSRAYREYLNPLNIEYTMIVALPGPDASKHDLGFTRGRSGRSFDTNDCALLNELVPHLERCFAIRRALTEGPQARGLSTGLNPPEIDCDVVRRMFTLSPTQARLAVTLFNGRSVKEAAEALGITEGTARQYLKQIFARTGARRQSDLVRIISGSFLQNS